MVSTYGYTSLAVIENITGIDYSAVDSVAFSDARVEASITAAEEMINGYFGVSAAVTVTNGITAATNLITIKLLNSKLHHLGYDEEMYELELTIPQILSLFLNETEDAFVESIPMSGANYHKPDFRMG